MRRVAAVDCGTNTIRLLVADLDPATGAGTDVVRRMRVVRLGQDVDKTGRFAEAALQRTFAVVEEYAATVRELGADALRFCATSAARDASNGAVFTDGVRQRIGVEPEVLPGSCEARLSYAGATRGLPAGWERRRPLVVDIGGGSTELIMRRPRDHADRAGGPAGPGVAGDGDVLACSLEVGSVRMTERHLHGDPATAAEVAAATADIDARLDDAGVPLSAADGCIGVAGTVTTVAAGVLGLTCYDPAAIHHARLTLGDIAAEVDRLLAMTTAQRRSLPYMHPGRADVIGAGALVLDRVLRRATPDSLLVCETDILDGIAWSVADG